MGVFDKIPTFLTVGVLVILFVCLKRHCRSARLTLWAVGWTLIFTHFLAQLLEPQHGPVSRVLLAVDLGALQAAAMVFLVSVSSVAEDGIRRGVLLSILLPTSVVYACLTAYDAGLRWIYVACLAICFVGGATLFYRVHRKVSWYLGSVSVICGLIAAWAVRQALRGSLDEGAVAFLGLGFSLPGVFIYRNASRATPAVVTVSAGFVAWGAVFPVGLIMDRFLPSFAVPEELWNVPKLLVALGMILAVVEEKSQSLTAMKQKAVLLSRQLERFSGITSRLLNGSSPETICPDIASAIAETTAFSAAVIYLEDGEHNLQIMGSSGFSGPSLLALEAEAHSCSIDCVMELRSGAPRLGPNAVLLGPESGGMGCGGGNPDAIDSKSSELLIAILSPAGACLGCIRLLAKQNKENICLTELARIEGLAADLAVAVELRTLHQQLVWSEKLAALGQLVAGVAHELNNPLTAVMGFAELVGDEVTVPHTREQLTRLISEAGRMKRIIENLLRFARQSAPGSHAVAIGPVVQEVLTLREYHTRMRNIKVEVEIEPGLPPLAANEDEIRQILLNLFNNASDALDSSPNERRIRVSSRRSGERAILEVEDSGPGFASLSRALDPFYTTKPVGKGTGLGLSVCYGIARQRGGDLRVENVKPHGARVTVELPIAETRIEPLLAAIAHA
jgi:signal transduction histidine kinase